MLSGFVQGRILSMFSLMIRPKVVLEIGTYLGYSALCFAEGLAGGGKGPGSPPASCWYSWSRSVPVLQFTGAGCPATGSSMTFTTQFNGLADP